MSLAELSGRRHGFQFRQQQSQFFLHISHVLGGEQVESGKITDLLDDRPEYVVIPDKTGVGQLPDACAEFPVHLGHFVRHL